MKPLLVTAFILAGGMALGHILLPKPSYHDQSCAALWQKTDDQGARLERDRARGFKDHAGGEVKVQGKTTRYGLSPRVGGWDSPGDSGTDSWMGCFGNKLNTSSCALTASMEAALVGCFLSASDARLMRDGNGQIIPGRLAPHTLLRVTFLAPADKMIFYRTFDDRAPESDLRLDIFLPWKDDPSIPDFGFVEVV